MPKSHLKDVFSHWHKPYDQFATSTMEFYAAVEAALKRRAIPGLAVSRVTYKESGFGSAKREYLRIRRRRLSFELCAAPFGSGYFFSWWLIDVKPSLLLILTTLLAPIAAWFGRPWIQGYIYRPVARWYWQHAHLYTPRTNMLLEEACGWASILVLLLVLAPIVVTAIRRGVFSARSSGLAVPLLGPLFDRLSRRETYYDVDTTLMFQSLVQGAVNEVIDSMMTAKGLRALTENEKKPVMRELAGSAVPVHEMEGQHA